MIGQEEPILRVLKYSINTLLKRKVMILSSFQFSIILYRYIVAAAAAKSLQSCSTLCDPIDGSPPGSPVPGILQARTLEWVAVSFSEIYS